MASQNLFRTDNPAPYKISRSKIELFLGCPCCFYLDRRHGVGRPDGPPFSLNLAVDALLKKEFDIYRLRGESHPLMQLYGVDAVPYRHKNFAEWRTTGIEALHGPSNLLVYGIVDDVWQHPDGALAIVDYKATSTAAPITLEGKWKEAYKRQLELYQWLLRKNGFTVSNTGYFVYVNADKDKEAFNKKLEFIVQVIPYTGSDDWIAEVLPAVRECLQLDQPPPPSQNCEWCNYRRRAMRIQETV